jgi:CSLREA domain-containing protein
VDLLRVIGSQLRVLGFHLVAAALAIAAALLLAGGAGAGRSETWLKLYVNSLLDFPDADPGDTVCRAHLGAGRYGCTLRAAIQTANARRLNVLIQLPPGAFTLTRDGKQDANALTGDLDVTTVRVNIVGTPATVVDGGGIDRVFDVAAFSRLKLSNLTIQGGRPHGGADGAGIRVEGTFFGEHLAIKDNSGHVGGGIYVAPGASAYVEASTIFHNVASYGAGLAVAGKADLLNVTIAGNNAFGAGGGVTVTKCKPYVGGPMKPGCATPGKVTLLHVTISGNTAPEAEAVRLEKGTAFGLRGSIVEGVCDLADSGATFPAGNVVTTQTCGAEAVNYAKLLPFGDYHYWIPVMGLEVGSPAIDAALPGSCPKTDERGVKRPIGAGCDAGAFETTN